MKIYFRFLKSYLQMDSKLLRLTGYILLSFLFQTVFIVLFQISYKEIFDAANQHREFSLVMAWIYVILAASVMRFIMSMLSDYLVGLATLRIFSELKSQFFHHLQWLPIRFYQGIKMGDLISRYANDLKQVEAATRQNLPILLRSLLLGSLSIAILFYFNWQLTLFALSIFPLVIIGARLFFAKAAKATACDLQASAELSSMIEEVATQHILVQAFNLQNRFLRRFQEKLADYKKYFIEGIFFRGMVSRTSFFGIVIVEALVFSVGAIMTYQGMMTVGTLFGFFALIWNLSGAVDQITQSLPNFIEVGSSLERVQFLLAKSIDDKKVKTPLSSISKSICFNQISFSHSDDKHVLKHLNLEIPIGRTIAFVGPTGSGKSTILSLLMGFYYPTTGTLTLDGQNVEDISLPSLRSHMGIVFQQSPLFNTTIRENIRIGRETASDQEVENAAKVVDLHDFILSLPNGYETPILEYGSNLSGGQKQRLAIARVYLRNPNIILLDEPTASLDLIVEEQINALIAKLAKGRTIVLATHRLASLIDVDHIYVLDKGEIIEQGAHEELLAKKGFYYNLWRKQNRITLDEEGKKSKIDLSFLRNVPLFKELPEELIAQLAEDFFMEWADAGQTIFKKGSAGEKFYIIARGRVAVLNPQLPPEESLLAILEDGDYFGEIALLENCVRTAEIKAISQCVFLVLHSSQFLRIIDRVPSLKKKLMERMQSRKS